MDYAETTVASPGRLLRNNNGKSGLVCFILFLPSLVVCVQLSALSCAFFCCNCSVVGVVSGKRLAVETAPPPAEMTCSVGWGIVKFRNFRSLTIAYSLKAAQSVGHACVNIH